ncbi:adenosylmethionine--8-amino-7-oxononanoate transaminase [Prosthecobacter sp.]|jgi:adenosylmethionine-8-amino-7-oxononanoate aminotransferase|uniref:adenosylmethionine--8-amino-7-oxononanoate transaminase n=1 Tax=Prosthecobacter sp. TaxID=1965333 RepID=UPI0037844DEA
MISPTASLTRPGVPGMEAPGMDSLASLDKRHLWHPFTPMRPWCAEDHTPLMLVEGRGCLLRDQFGNEYLDGNASIWTNIHGHNHPVINAAIIEQLGKVAHTSFLGFTHDPAIRLAKELVELVPGGKLTRAFFTDNGSTAIESAVRMALQYWKQNGRPESDTLVAFDHAYHGDTLGAASLGGIPLFKGSGNDFGYHVVTVSCVEELASLDANRIAAVIIEPLIQGAAGMRLWPQGMLKALDRWCVAQDVFLILDEVMTGFGRTGKMFACEHEEVVPDFLCLAKGITGGYLPFAATLTTERVFEGFLGDPSEGRTFFYGHSYAGSQLGCAAALASLRVFRDERVLEQLPAKIARLGELMRDLPAFRQCGMIAAMTVDGPDLSLGAKICLAARKHGLLTRPIGNTLVLMPPLCVTLEEIERMVGALKAALAEVM